jgi:NTE family protein
LETRYLALITIFFLAASSGCATAKRSSTLSDREIESQKAQVPSPPGGQVYGPDAPYGPAAPPPQPEYGPLPSRERPVVLVLGPGLARGYAYSGVIRALTEAKIKIGAIYGTEMGALIGALYAIDGSVNKLEWGVLRFKDDVFEMDDSMLSKLLKKDPADRLDTSLEQVFGARELSQTKVPVKILAQVSGAGARAFDHGSLRLLVRAALGNVNEFSPVLVDGATTGTAGLIRPFDVEDAKASGIGPVIAVNVLDPKESDLYPELKQADLIINPDVGGISKTDFSKRTDAVLAGKAATREHLDEIKRLVGGAAP